MAHQGAAQRDVSGLHCLSNHSQEIVAQGIELCLVPDLGREGFQGLSSVIFAPVEESIYEALYATPQWVEQRSNYQRETTMTSCGCSCWPVRARKTAWVAVTPPKYTKASMAVSRRRGRD